MPTHTAEKLKAKARTNDDEPAERVMDLDAMVGASRGPERVTPQPYSVAYTNGVEKLLNHIYPEGILRGDYRDVICLFHILHELENLS